MPQCCSFDSYKLCLQAFKGGKALLPPVFHFFLCSDEVMEKEHFAGKSFLIVHSLLEKMAVESSIIKISLRSSTFQGKHFQLKFGRQDCHKVVYKTVLQTSPKL